MGGGTPGPRFLIPVLPFLTLGLAPAYRRFKAITLGLAIPSALTMLAAALTYPLLGEDSTGTWISWLGQGSLEHTVLSAVGVTNAWVAVLPVLAAIAAAVSFAARATPSVRLGSVRAAVYAVLAWTVAAVAGPSLAGDSVPPLDDASALVLVGMAAATSALVLLVLRRREARGERAPERSLMLEPARIS
jgi:hypothetical protein